MVALESAYRDRYPDLLRVATAITGSVESGRDAVHDAFVDLIRARESYRRNGHLEAWAWAAVVNAARKQARRRGSLPLEEEALDRPPTNGEQVGRHGAVRAAIARLPERQRLALFLRYYAAPEPVGQPGFATPNRCYSPRNRPPRPTCAGAAHPTPSPRLFRLEHQPHRRPARPARRSRRVNCAEGAKTRTRANTAKSHSRLRRPTFRAEVSRRRASLCRVAGVAQLVEQAPCKR